METFKIDKNLVPGHEKIIPVYEKLLKNEKLDFFTRRILINELSVYYFDFIHFILPVFFANFHPALPEMPQL